MKWKRTIAALLVLVMTLQMIPVLAAADEEGSWHPIEPPTSPCTAEQEKAIKRLYDDTAYVSAPVLDLREFDIPATEENMAWCQYFLDHLRSWEYFNVGGFGPCEKAYDSKTGTEIISEIPIIYDPKAMGQWEEYHAAVVKAIGHVSDSMTTEEKVLTLHDYLCDHVSYNRHMRSGGNEALAPGYVYSAYGAMAKGDAVCGGYSSAFRALLNRIGVENIWRHSQEDQHAWNLVQIDGEWFNIDVTWDDGRYKNQFKDYHCFLQTDQQSMDKGHYHTGGYYDPGVICNSTRYIDDPNWLLKRKHSRVEVFNGIYYLLEDQNLFCATDLHGEVKKIADIAESDFDLRICYGYGSEQNDFFYLKTGPGTMLEMSEKMEYECDLMHLDLRTGQIELLDHYVLKKRPSPEGYVEIKWDYPIIMYRGDGLLELVSSNQPETPAHTYQFHPEPEVYLPTVRGSEVTCFYALDLAANPGAGAWAAFYENGQMKGLRPLQSADQFYHQVTFDTENMGTWDEMQVLLLDQNSQPLCASYALPKPKV